MGATEQKRQPNERSKFLRNLLFWLLLLPIVMGSLFLCGQMALWFSPAEQAVDTRSRIKADYQPWQFQQVAAIDVAALQQDIINEQGSAVRIPASTLQTGDFWPEQSATPVILAGPVVTPTPTESGLITVITPTPTSTTLLSTPTQTKTFTPTSATATATVTNTPVRTATPTATATPTLRVATNTPTSTHIPTTPVVWTPTPTRTPVIIHITYTFTPTPTQTNTSTITPTPTITSTPTVTPTPTNTSTPTDTPTPTDTVPPPTFTFTPTPTETPVPAYIPVRPIAENSGLADPVGTDSCQGYFGYKNDNAYDVTLAKGVNNQIVGSYTGIFPSLPYTGNDVPTLFYSGRFSGAFRIVWNTAGPISWDLDGRTATFPWCR
jgi:hypothetical protein